MYSNRVLEVKRSGSRNLVFGAIVPRSRQPEGRVSPRTGSSLRLQVNLESWLPGLRREAGTVSLNGRFVSGE